MRGVVIDVDGTLVDSTRAEVRAWFEALSSQGIAASVESIRSRLGLSGDRFLRSLCGIAAPDPVAERILACRSRLFMTRHLGDVRAEPHARKLLERMHGDHLRRVAIGSCPAIELDAMLEIAGVSDLIGARVACEDVPAGTRTGHPLERALEVLDLPASSVVMIGDTPYDIDAAERMGVAVIAVRSGGWDDRILSRASAIYDSISDLLSFYEASPLDASRELEGSSRAVSGGRGGPLRAAAGEPRNAARPERHASGW